MLPEKVVDVHNMSKNHVLKTSQCDALDEKLPFAFLDDVYGTAASNGRLDSGGKYTSPVLMYDNQENEDDQMLLEVDGCRLDDLDMKGKEWKVMEVQSMLNSLEDTKNEADDHGLQNDDYQPENSVSDDPKFGYTNGGEDDGYAYKDEDDDHGLQVDDNGMAGKDDNGEVKVADSSYPGSHWDYYTALNYAAWAVRR